MTLLESLDKNLNVNISHWRKDPISGKEKDLIKILTTKINSANPVDHDQFINSIQFDIEEPKIFSRAMQGSDTAKWAKAIKEKLDQLYKNKTWILVHWDEMELGYRALREKLVYKIK